MPPARSEGAVVGIACPCCGHTLTMRQPKPGRFRSTCSACATAFAVEVARTPDGGYVARRPNYQPTPAFDANRTIPNRPAPPDQTPAPKSKFLAPISRTPPPPPAAVEPLSGVADDDTPPPPQIDGYRIEKELGRGGMGAVYLARQLSLDRPVALKVMATRYAADPVFVARFTREAFAAAQLSHPNIVQIYDIGEADGARFFSMEYVAGRSLADVLADRGKLDAATAVAYVLQAARGLKHAHDRGMVHRDVKPDNLLLDEYGLVKVGDLGLVKVAGVGEPASVPPPSPLPPPACLTGFRIALGTPAYMSPEQCRDATTVDHRADIYSLGCTLYVLLTGKPPFDGMTAVEVMSKHAYDPVVPPERVVARVPSELSWVIQRMMAKDAGERFRDMGDVIRTLEDWLGIRGTSGGFVPQEEQIARVERYAHTFATAPAAVKRGHAVACGIAATTAVAALLLFFGRVSWAATLMAMLAQGGAAYFALAGRASRGPVYTRIRGFGLGLGWADRAILAAGVGLLALLLAMSGALTLWAGAGVFGVALALVVRQRFDRRVADERAAPVRSCGRLIRQLRAEGHAEDEVRLFVARYAGRTWEEFFEALFGYDAKLAARAILLRGDWAGRREKHAVWREPLLALLDALERKRQDARERRLLDAIDQARLQAEAAAGGRRGKTAPRPTTGEPVPAFGRITPGLLGSAARAVAASVLLAGCVLWAHQNGLLPGGTARGAGPLVLDDMPPALTGWADGWNAGVAGLLVLASLCFRGNLMAVLVCTGAGLVVAGHHLGIQTVEPLRPSHVGLLLGTVVAFVGFRTGTR